MIKSDNGFPDAPKPVGRLLDDRLPLLDRQILDADGEPVGIVDDLDLGGMAIGDEIARGTPTPRISGILTGQVLATRIFGGRPPRARLQPLPWRLVARIGTTVQLCPTDQALDDLWVERWLRDHLVGRIPGGDVQLSELLGLDVVDATGQRVGTVLDVRLAAEGDLDDGPAQPRLFGLVVSPRTGSSYLGYERSDARRSAVLAALLRWRHRGTFLVVWDDVARIDPSSVVLRAHSNRYSPTLRDDD